MGAPAVQQNINSSLSRIASSAKVENNTLTFISNEPVRTFEIKYHGVEGSSTFSTLGNQTPEHERLLKKNFREHDGAVSTTTNIHSEGRYNCKITHLPDGKTKFEVTFDSKIQNAAIEVNNKVSNITLVNGKPDNSLHIDDNREAKGGFSNISNDSLNALDTRIVLPEEQKVADKNPENKQVQKEIDPSTVILLDERLNETPSLPPPDKSNDSTTENENVTRSEIPPASQLVKKEIPTRITNYDVQFPAISREVLRQSLANANPSAAIAYAASAITPREAVSKDAMSAELEKKIHEIKSAVLKDTPKDINGLKKQLFELDELQASHTKLHGKDVARLEKEASRSIEGSDLHTELNNKIKNINGVQESIKESRRNILENSAKATDSELSTFAKKELIKMRSEILSDYDNKISAAKSTQEVTKLTQEKADFKKSNDSHIKEVGTKTEKLRVYVEGTKAYNAARDAASSVYTAAKERVFGSPVQSAEKVLALETKDVSLRRLERLYQSLENAESKVNTRYAKNNNSIAPDKLQELKANVALKIEDKLKADISNAKTSVEKSALQDSLYEKHGHKIIKGKEILSQDSSVFKGEQKSYLDLRNREAVLKESGLKSILPSESKSVLHRLTKIETELLQQPNSDLLKAEKAHLLAIKEKLILEKEIAALSPDDNARILDKRNLLLKQNEVILECKGKYWDQLESNLALEGLDPKERARLVSERTKLAESLDDFEAKAIVENAAHQQSKALPHIEKYNTSIDEIQRELASKKALLQTEENPEIRKSIELEINELEHKNNAVNRLKIHREIVSHDAFINPLKERIAVLEKSINLEKLKQEANYPLDANQKSELAAKQAEHKRLSRLVEDSESNKKFLNEKKSLLDKKIELYEKTEALKELQKNLASTTDETAKGSLQSEVDKAKSAHKALSDEVIAKEKAFSGGFKARMLQAQTHFNKEVMPKMVRQNPALAATVAGFLSEATFAAMKADVSDDGVHSAIPSLITLFSKDMREWSEFTTADYGPLTARLSEVTNASGNVAIIGGLFYGAQRTGGYLGIKGPSAGVLRAAGLAGVAYHSFDSFSNLDLVNATDTQVNGTIGSTLAAGAITGATVGTFIPIPIVGTGSGLVVGVGVAFTMDLAGTAYNLTQLDDKYKNDYVKKGIKDSIWNARNGMVKAEGFTGSLSVDEVEVIDSLAKVEIIGQLFQGTNVDGTRMFSDMEIKLLGFEITNSSMSTEELHAVYRSNWERLEDLYERGEGVLFRDQINYLKERNPELGTKFENLTNDSKKHYEDLYRRSYKIEFEATFPNSAFDIWIGTSSDDMGGIKITKNELADTARTFNNFYHGDLSSEEDKANAIMSIRKNFPNFDTIFLNENTAQLFINSFMVQDNISKDYLETPLSNLLRQYYTALKEAPRQIDSNVAEIVKM